MKRKDQGPGLFDWADAQPAETIARAECKAQPPAEVVDFLTVRPTMPRWILARRTDLELALNDFDKRMGLMPPTPILPFKREA